MFAATQASPFQSVFLAMFLFFAGLILIPLIRSPNTRTLSLLFSVAFILRIFVTYITYYYLVAVGGDGFAFTDDRVYDAAGSQIAAALNAGKDGYALHSWQQNPGYFYFNGLLYSLLGTDTFSARIVNSFLSSLTVVFVFEIARLLFSVKVARVSGFLYAFMPSIVYLSALQFKDTALIFVMVYTVYLLMSKTKKRITILSAAAVIVSLIVMWFIRKDYTLPYIGIVIMWLILRYTGLELFIDRMRKSGLSVVSAVAILFVGGAVLAGLTNTQAGKVFLDRYDTIAGSNKELVENASRSGIGFSRRLRINSAMDIYKLPFAVGFVTILPLPAIGWLTSGEHAGVALYSIANLAFIFILPYVVLGFRLIKDVGFGNSVMIKWFPIVVLVAISIMFMGVLRYKEQLMPFFLMWAALGICHRKQHRAFILSSYVVGAMGVLFAVVMAATIR